MARLNSNLGKAEAKKQELLHLAKITAYQKSRGIVITPKKSKKDDSKT